MSSSIDTVYFKKYRKRLGFSSMEATKGFFSAKDIRSDIDFKYLAELNSRIYAIVDKVNGVVVDDIRVDNMANFKSEHIDRPFQILKDNNILTNLNNQGRRPEEVYYSWIRGHVFSVYFIKALSDSFGVDSSKIVPIGDDNLNTPDFFKRTPKSDLEIDMGNNSSIRIEVQTGFKGINDIKKHKVTEAQKVYSEAGTPTEVVHFDLFNGQVAFIPIHEIKDCDEYWIRRQQMEGQVVFNIGQNYFLWRLTEAPTKYADIQKQRQ